MPSCMRMDSDDVQGAGPAVNRQLNPGQRPSGLGADWEWRSSGRHCQKRSEGAVVNDGNTYDMR